MSRKRDHAREEGVELESKKVEMAFLKKRGHIPFWGVITVYVASTILYICVSMWLLGWEHTGVLYVLVFFGFIYIPLLSYITARLEGLVGQVVELPFIREAGFILSGYQGVAVWFIPFPIHNYGIATMEYRVAELTGTSFWSKWKAEVVLMPIILVCLVIFANFIWGLGPIPSTAYPFANEIWEFQAKNMCLIYTATEGEFSQFQEAISAKYIGEGVGLGLVLFGAFTIFSLPTMMMYGVVRGMNQTLPHVVLPQFFGALLSKFYFERRMGLRWRQYAPVLAAGFSCGMGLITILSIGIMFLSKAVIQAPF